MLSRIIKSFLVISLLGQLEACSISQIQPSLSPEDQVKEILVKQWGSPKEIKVAFEENFALAEYSIPSYPLKRQMLLVKRNDRWSVLHDDPGSTVPGTLVRAGIDRSLANQLYEKLYPQPEAQVRLAALSVLQKGDAIETWIQPLKVAAIDKYALVDYLPNGGKGMKSQLVLIKTEEYGWQNKYDISGPIALNTLVQVGVPQEIAKELTAKMAQN